MTDLRYFKVGEGFELAAMRQEVKDMTDVLLGRTDPPISVGVMTLMEIAEAYHARAREMEMMLHEAEIDGMILKGSKAYRFRTQQLRSFIQMVERTIDLGSRRITTAMQEARY